MHLPTPRSGTADQNLQTLSAKARDASSFLKAIAHHSRLLILHLLSDEEKTVGQLEESLGIQQAMVSQQLARLRMEGLVSSRREGRQIYYRVTRPDIVIFLRSLFDQFPEPHES
ncbi:metalloregulator ArsR/SmtB family transcription factor [Rhizobium sp. Root1220]|uniref:ArsR/SmtB family transcription factor n=1 Tax=Rhizobium sp. Root1220 TaxID=1736432 RepID=UPI0006F65448|nr:metalloregulator ArsR/SmtB family transcription factor [Rhizobium sp. Root1220]KQV73218.1 ArsR family transcriptional regulator [Rhizobium sp. Root1220]